MNGVRKNMPNLIGKVFGLLVVLRKSPVCHGDVWQCRCVCGAVVNHHGSDLRRGSPSCGNAKATRELHGFQKRGKPPGYRSWSMMRNRCNNPLSSQFKWYGGRGIKVCERWESFEAFFTDMGPKPTPDHEIDRIDNDGNYEPGNCRWATRKEQMNNVSSNVVIAMGGETHTVAEWADILGMSRFAIYQRIEVLGWEPTRALTTPVRSINRKGTVQNVAE